MHPEIERVSTPMVARKRQSNKPLTERKRREKINNFLSQLKSLILQKTDRQENEHCRLEKADILEMTVQYLQNGTSSVHSKTTDYTSGFIRCQEEVFRLLNQDVSVSNDVKMRLFCHLSGQQTGTSHQTQAYSVDQSPAGLANNYTCPVVSGHTTPSHSMYASDLHRPVQVQQWSPDPMAGAAMSSPSLDQSLMDTSSSLPLCTPNGFNMSNMEWFRGYSEWCHSSPDVSSVSPDVSSAGMSEISRVASHDSASTISDSSSSSVWRPW
ncbi:transcription factor HES-2-like [Mizuhopecten yessoensis]|uniref:transcription factor HES-2-like n=1 Tax=Mizuhopecten yessoensis TaxID=6573 RepID=UPI000B45F678|nr:transcription factor HES-2-like [Mizuhopecten yessoensis]